MTDQLRHYHAKLEYEIDPYDLNEALGRGDKILLVDTRSPKAYEKGHIPGAVNMLQLGFRVKELIGGLDCWRSDGYPVDGLEAGDAAGSCGCS